MISIRSTAIAARGWLHKFFATARNGNLLAWLFAHPADRTEAKGFSLQSTTGETVYRDRPLRFRSLTLAEADVPMLEDPENAPGFKIRISKLKRGRVQAGALVSHRYSSRGYQAPNLKKETDLYTFIAYDEGELVGTVGVRLDSHTGLAADELYLGEIAGMRAQGFKLCEFTRLAVDKRAASKPVLAGLFHTAYLYASVMRGMTHAVIEVNPRHVTFYRRALSFEAIGPERMSSRVNAPAVLLCVSFATIADGLANYVGRPNDPGAEKSLFPYGFDGDEARGVLRRLERLADD